MREILLTSSVLILVLAAVRLLVPVPIGHSALSLLNWTEEKAVYEAALPVEDQGTVPAVPTAPEVPEAPQTQPVPGGTAVGGGAVPSSVREEGGALLTWVWLTGCAGMAAWFLAVNLRFRRRARAGAEPLEEDCPLPVWVSPNVPSPCLVGLVRPRIYLTPACLERPDSLRHVLAHEEVHWRHRDPWWALVRGLCLCLYWFDPWCGGRRICPGGTGSLPVTRGPSAALARGNGWPTAGPWWRWRRCPSPQGGFCRPLPPWPTGGAVSRNG